MQDEVFKLIHDQTRYKTFQRMYNRLCYLIYIERITKYLKQYIEHYSKCQLNQIK